MAETSIQWCDFTFNGWGGCEKVSPGCKHCYAEARDRRFHDGAHWGPAGVRRRTSPSNWRKPLAWDRAAVQANVAADVAGKPRPPRPRVFCASLADVFEDRRELDEWRVDLLRLVRATPNLDWLLLTKRPEHIRSLLMRAGESLRYDSGDPKDDELRDALWGWLVAGDPIPWPNVWLGTTVEDQQRAVERIPALLEVPAVVRFLSCEPLLERVRLDVLSVGAGQSLNGLTGERDQAGFGGPGRRWQQHRRGIDWVIIGGESGPGARPFHLDWARDLLRQCRRAGVAPFVKQLGARPMQSQESAMVAAGLYPDDHGPRGRQPEPFRLADSHGGDMAEWPEDLRVREFPSP